MAIPFKTLRYKDDLERWGINFFRINMKTNEIYAWTRMPVNFEPQEMGYTGTLIWDKPPPKAGANISIIPYVKGSNVANHEPDPDTNEYNFDAGMDAKIALTSSLNLDLTVNPDFSQVDVDEQQTNLTRFEIDYPEKRAFFLRIMIFLQIMVRRRHAPSSPGE